MILNTSGSMVLSLVWTSRQTTPSPMSHSEAEPFFANAGLPVSKGALDIELDGIVSEQPTEVDPLAALSGGARLKEVRVRDVVHALEVAADDSSLTSDVLDLARFLGGWQVSPADI